MSQLMKMFLFYHESAHIIQQQSPNLFDGIIDESKNDEFLMVDHVGEIDADLHASRKIAEHLSNIFHRDSSSFHELDPKKYLEDLCITTISSYLFCRMLIFDNYSTFYTKKHSHPHILIRMQATMVDIIKVVQLHTGLVLDTDRVFNYLLSVTDLLCTTHSSLQSVSTFLGMSVTHSGDISEYYDELIKIIRSNKKTVYNKMSL